MAQGENAKKYGHPGREYWSRRPFSGVSWGKANKQVTHRMERAQEKLLVRRELLEHDNDE